MSKGQYKRGITTRVRMSTAKEGEKNPNFKGWYVINGKKYSSAREAEKATGIAARTVIRRCKGGKDNDYGFISNK